MLLRAVCGGSTHGGNTGGPHDDDYAGHTSGSVFNGLMEVVRQKQKDGSNPLNLAVKWTGGSVGGPCSGCTCEARPFPAHTLSPRCKKL